MISPKGPVGIESELAMNKFYLALALTAIALPAYAQTSTPKGTTSTVDRATQQFVEKAAVGDLYEIDSSRLAMERSQNDEIQDFAEQIVDDHTKTGDELKSLARNIQGLEVPAKMDAEHQKKVDQLKSASAAQFDRQYKMQQIEAHKAAVQLFSDYSKNGQNAELKSFAEKTLPALREHLEMAQALPEGGARVGQAPANTHKTEQQNVQQRSAGRLRIASPGPDHILASDLTGTNVYGSNNEEIGDISDVILDRNGRLVAVVVGVGGFLGIGEKNVAIPFDAIEISPRAAGGKSTADSKGSGTMEPERIVLRGMTKQDLEAAPSFNAENSRTDPAASNRDRTNQR
jgi:putative membrane protein